MTALLEELVRRGKQTTTPFTGRFEFRKVCDACGAVSIRSEATDSFELIKIELRGVENVEQALDALMAPEVLSGVFCDACNAKSSAHRTTTLE